MVFIGILSIYCFFIDVDDAVYREKLPVSDGDSNDKSDQNENVKLTYLAEYDYASKINDKYIKVKKNGKYGIIDSFGKSILDNQYDEIEQFGDKYIKIKKDGKYGIADEFGVFEETKYDEIKYLIDDYYYFLLGDKKILGRKGHVVADITINQPNKVYKDESDKDSLYIMIDRGEYRFVCSTGSVNLGGTFRAVTIDKEYDIDINQIVSNKVLVGSIIYDAKTGKIIKEVPGAISLNQTSTTDNTKYIAHFNSDCKNSNQWTYYDSNFNNLLSDNYHYFAGSECDGNDLLGFTNSANIVTHELGYSYYSKYGYYSLEQKKQILPIAYEHLYAKNKKETLFVVGNNSRYGLVDNQNQVKLAFEYDYMTIVNDYIFTIKDNIFKVYDSSLKYLKEFTHRVVINDDSPYISELCSLERTAILNYTSSLFDIGLIEVFTDKGTKSFVITDTIKEYDGFVDYDTDEDHAINYVIETTIKNGILNNIMVYDNKMNLKNSIDISSYHIEEKNRPSYHIYGDNFEIDMERGDKNVLYYNLTKKIFMESMQYELDKNYFYMKSYNDNGTQIPGIHIYNKNDGREVIVIEEGLSATNASNNLLIVTMDNKYRLYKFDYVSGGDNKEEDDGSRLQVTDTKKEELKLFFDNMVSFPLSSLVVSTYRREGAIPKNFNFFSSVENKQLFVMECILNNPANDKNFVLGLGDYPTSDDAVAYYPYDLFNNVYKQLFNKDFDVSKRVLGGIDLYDKSSSYVYYIKWRGGNNGVLIDDFHIKKIMFDNKLGKYVASLELVYSDRFRMLTGIESDQAEFIYSIIDDRIVSESFIIK